MTRPAILSIATGVPPYGAAQDHMLGFMNRVGETCLPPEEARRWSLRLRALYANSRIQKRYSPVADFLASGPQDFTFFPPNWNLEPFPSTSSRMALYESASVELATEVSREAIAEAGLTPAEITHVVVCTCTGFFAPGPDVALIQNLGLPPTTQRSIIGYMGCHGGFNGLRTCHQIVRADPGARVLQVCVELCTLHMQKEFDDNAALSNCLFGDGCAALICADDRANDSPLATVETFASVVAPASARHMTWHIGDTGFEMQLTSEVPKILRDEAQPFMNSLLDRARLSIDDVAHWVIHPGGARILDAVAEALSLSDESMAPSTGVLRDYGNMSSPTVFFILERILQERPAAGPVALIGFGPGLTIEGAILKIPEV